MLITLKLICPNLAPAPSPSRHKPGHEGWEMHSSFMTRLMLVGAKQGAYTFVLSIYENSVYKMNDCPMQKLFL